MFTGIVEELGELVGRHEQPDAARFAVRGPLVCADTRPGDSIAVNGACLTVVAVETGVFTADVIGETLRRSTLGSAAVGDRLNLERAAKLGDRLGGHLVQGHVDARGTVLSRTPAAATGAAERTRWEGNAPDPGAWELIRIGVPAALARYLVEKGSITVDGVSLTVIEAGPDEFTVGLIPSTRELTTLGLHHPGQLVNLEVDVIAKYVERLASAHLAPPGAGLRDDADREVR
ncbi:MAG TPA: riboflavin synthase [Pseudonocardiaceae bacterium]|nr:riboflavin synthase [Pseudonocardiaceae bacterium]